MNTHASYDPQYFIPLFQAEGRHFWFISRNRILEDVLKSLDAQLPAGYFALELGCGNGNTLRVTESACQRGKVTGSDLFFSGLRLARLRVSCPLVQADVQALPFERKFSLVGFFDVLEHIRDDRGFIEKVKQILLPGGYLVVTVPADPALWSYFDEASHHERRYTSEALTQLLEESGYEIVRMTAFMSLTYPVVWLRRKLAGKQGNPGTQIDSNTLALQELHVAGILNWLLIQLLKLELAWLKRGRSFKRGSSLLAIARLKIN